MDKIEERLDRIEGLIHQLMDMMAKNNERMHTLEDGMKSLEGRMDERMHSLEARLDERIASLETGVEAIDQRLDHWTEGTQKDVALLQSQSTHFAQKIGVIERDVAVLQKK